MYYDYFGLTEAPFSIAPNPEYLFMTNRHQEALAHLYHSVESDSGFILLTGDVGTGKTTICRSFLEKLPDDTEVAFILNPFLSGRELLMMICQELKIEDHPEDASLRQLTNAIYTHLLNNHAIGKQTVLLIDEAQHLHFKVLELIRLLTNLETDRHKLLKIVLVGQPELNQSLAKPELSQLSQRISARYHIKPLNYQETTAYIDYRLRMAGYLSEKKIFPKNIVKKIFSMTGGVPRIINVICDRALLGAYSQNKAEVDETILKKAIIEVKGETYTQKDRRFWIFFFISSLLLILIIILSALLFKNTNTSNNDSGLRSSLPNKNIKVESAADDNSSETNLGNGLVERDNKASNDESLLVINNKPQPTISSSSAISFFVSERSAMTSLINSVIKDNRLAGSRCEDIIGLGWQCQKVVIENWQALERYNRPAVIKLVNLVGEQYYLPITGINPDFVDVKTPSGDRRVAIKELGREWSGEIVYLWQPPKDFDNFIFFDSGEVLVDWLARAFAIIDERDEVLAKKQFNNLLKKRVALFQRENNLTEDGIAGFETLLKLNERLGIAVTLNSID